MEVKINKEIRDYSENIYFGLSLRQFFFSVLACLSAVIIYLLFKNSLDMEINSWLCILGAVPFVALGFFTYNGMKTEKFCWVWIKYEFLVPKQLIFRPTNYYYEILKEREEKNCENIN